MTSELAASNTELFSKYLDSCKEGVKSKSTEGYYHVNVVAEAYTRGFSDGKQLGKSEFMDSIISAEIEKFTQKANQIYILSKKFVSYILESGYTLTGLYIKLRMNRPVVIVSVPDVQLNDDAFVVTAYSKLHEFKNIFNGLFGDHLDFGLVSSDSLNEKLLKEEGFGYSENYK